MRKLLPNCCAIKPPPDFTAAVDIEGRNVDRATEEPPLRVLGTKFSYRTTPMQKPMGFALNLKSGGYAQSALTSQIMASF